MPHERNENPVYTRNRGFSYRGDFDGGTRVIYEGFSNPNNAESAEKWQIVKHTYTSTRLTASDWAQKTLDNGSKVSTDEFLFSWDDRTTLTYGAAT